MESSKAQACFSPSPELVKLQVQAGSSLGCQGSSEPGRATLSPAHLETSSPRGLQHGGGLRHILRSHGQGFPEI